MKRLFVVTICGLAIFASYQKYKNYRKYHQPVEPVPVIAEKIRPKNQYEAIRSTTGNLKPVTSNFIIKDMSMVGSVEYIGNEKLNGSDDE